MARSVELALLMLATAVSGCLAARRAPPPAEPTVVVATDAGAPVVEELPEPPSLAATIVEEASRWVGRRSLKAVLRGMKDDCIGLVRFVYARAGLPLEDHAFARSARNAVNGLYQKLRSAGLVRRADPLPGDMVFFRDTYDVNRDGKRNDGMTHIGIIEEVQDGGTVLFIHRDRRGVVKSAANPSRPRQLEDAEGKKMNDYIRRQTLEHRGYLAGELISGFVSPSQLQSLLGPPVTSDRTLYR